MPNGKSGLVLDGLGGIHPFSVDGGVAPTVAGAPYWPSWKISTGIAILPDGSGGYVLDGLGGLHPFSINGGATPPPEVLGPYNATKNSMRGVTLLADATGGYLIDYFGGVFPSPSTPAASRSFRQARLTSLDGRSPNPSRISSPLPHRRRRALWKCERRRGRLCALSRAMTSGAELPSRSEAGEFGAPMSARVDGESLVAAENVCGRLRIYRR